MLLAKCGFMLSLADFHQVAIAGAVEPHATGAQVARLSQAELLEWCKMLGFVQTTLNQGYEWVERTPQARCDDKTVCKALGTL